MNQEQLILYHQAEMYHDSGRVDLAISVYRQMISKFPENADAHYALGMCLLLIGDFQHGWPEHEWRLKTERMAVPSTGKPYWARQPLTGKTILIITDQGFGDAIQFVRYACNIKAEGGNVVLGCHERMKELLGTCSGVDEVVIFGSSIPPHDYQMPLLSTANIFHTLLETIPANVPYLHVPGGAGEKVINEIIRHKNTLRVGLAWEGGPKGKAVSYRRSLKLDQLYDLLNTPGVKFFSLPRFAGDLDINSLPPGLVTNLGPYLENIIDIAAAVQTLDLIISVDTTLVHLAGALAKPVWTLIPFVPDWRWMLVREDSPWYPTMRLFRQSAPGDWSSVVKRVSGQLRALADSK